MARIVPGSALAELRGKIGGMVVSRNASGAYVRNFVSPVQPNTDKQIAIRQAATYCALRWRNTLTATQRLAWEIYARATPVLDKFGSRNLLSGIAHYLRYNVEMRRQHEVLLDDAPAIPGVGPMILMTATGDTADGVRVTAVLPGVGADDYYEIYACGGPTSQARNFFNGPWTWRKSIFTAQPVPQEIVPATEVQIGQRWWLRCRAFMSDGKVGAPSYAHVDILA
jgi:hypothetical protein